MRTELSLGKPQGSGAVGHEQEVAASDQVHADQDVEVLTRGTLDREKGVREHERVGCRIDLRVKTYSQPMKPRRMVTAGR